MRDIRDAQSWNAYSYVNNNPLKRVDPDGMGFWEKLTNALSGFGWRSNQEVELEVQRRREWLNNNYYERDAQGNWRRYNANGLSTSDVWTTYDIIQDEMMQGRMYQLTAEEIAQAIGASPALRDDPYSPDEVAKRQSTELNQLRQKMQSVGREAERLGFPRRIPPQRAPFNSHGQEVFTDGSRFITRDVDSHSGGVWKMFDRSGRRLGTYDGNLNRIGP